MAEPYTFEAHSTIPVCKIYPIPRCKWCGLVYLKNDITRIAIRLGCNHTLHPDWNKLTK